MSKGFPDWFGNQVFPFYGDTNMDGSLVPSVNAGSNTQIVAITDKGRIYGGSLELTQVTGTFDNIKIGIQIDGTSDWLMDLGEVFDFGFDDAYPLLLKITNWNIVTGKACFAINKDITFGWEFRMRIDNQQAAAVAVDLQLWWAKVYFS